MSGLRSKGLAPRAMLLMLFGAVACPGAEPPAVGPAAPRSAASSSPGRWVQVRAPDDPALLELPARMVGPAEASGVVAAPLRAKVLHALVRVGQRVDRGAPVVEVVIPELLHAAATVVSVEQRLAAVERRLGELAALKAEGLARSEAVFELEARQAELAAERTLARAGLDAAGLGPLDAKALAARGSLTLRSPAAGVVTTLEATPGEVREPGGAPFARVVGEGVGRVEARLVRPVPAAKSAEFVTGAGERYGLLPKPVAEVIEPTDGARTAWFELADRRPLGSGLRGRVVLHPEASSVLELPAAALREEDGKPFVLRRKGDAREPVAVTVLARAGAAALVEAQLAVGDEVLVVSGEDEPR